MRTRKLTWWVLALAVIVAATGCTLEQEISRTPRTAVEQVLLTQAVERALVNLAVDLPEEVNVEVDATSLDTDRPRLRMTDSDIGSFNSPSRDILYIRDTVASALGRRGFRVRARNVEAPYLVRVMAESFGTMQGMTFVGMPPVQSVLIPFALPELTLYKAMKQRGYARLHLDVYDYRTGEFLGSTATIVGRSFFDQYTVLFFITWQVTDIVAPP